MRRALRSLIVVLWCDRGLLFVAGLLGTAAGATAITVVVVDAVLLHPVATPDPGRIVSIGGLASGAGMTDPVRWWNRTDALRFLALYRVGDAPSRDGAETTWIRVAEVSSQFLSTFAIRPILGRDFQPEDEGTAVALLSHSVWRSRFGGEASALGSSIDIDGKAHVVIGVVPPRFDFPSASAAWIARPGGNSGPVLVERSINGLPPVRVTAGWVGRLQPRATVVQAREQLSALLDKANRELSPVTGIRYGNRVGVTPLVTVLTRDSRGTVYFVAVSSGLLLLLATLNCFVFSVNAHAKKRAEIAIRLALGATVGRLRLHEIERAVALGVVAGLCSSLVAIAGTKAVPSILATGRTHLPQDSSFTFMAVGLGFALALLAALAGAIFSPVRLAEVDVIRSVGGRMDLFEARRQRKVRRWLIGCEIACAVILIVTAAHTGRRLVAWRPASFGFSQDSATTALVGLPRVQAPDRRFVLAPLVIPSLIRKAESIPGVLQAAIASDLPVSRSRRRFVQVSDGNQQALTAIVEVTRGYFGALDIPLTAGRPPESLDEIVINQQLASHLWRSSSPLGRMIGIAGQDVPFTVCGVATDTQLVGEAGRPVPEVYVPFAPEASGAPLPPVRLIVRCGTACDSVGLKLASIGEPGVGSIARVDAVRDLALEEARPLQARAIVVSLGGAISLAVSIIGTFALVAGAVTARRFEAGMKLSLGASRPAVVRSLAADGLWSTFIGTILGGLGAVALSRWAGSVVLGLQQVDTAGVVLPAAMIAAVGALASIVPALPTVIQTPAELLGRRN